MTSIRQKVKEQISSFLDRFAPTTLSDISIVPAPPNSKVTTQKPRNVSSRIQVDTAPRAEDPKPRTIRTMVFGAAALATTVAVLGAVSLSPSSASSPPAPPGSLIQTAVQLSLVVPGEVATFDRDLCATNLGEALNISTNAISLWVAAASVRVVPPCAA